MLEKTLKVIFDFIDYFLAHQVPSKMGFGHQINSSAGLDQNSFFISDTIASLNKPVKIIELASGRGVLANEIAKIPHVEYYLACDIDPTGLEIFKNRISKQKYSSKVETLVMDALNPSTYKKEYFDIVVAEKFIHLLSPDDILKVFKLAHELLKPDGLFFISSASNTNFVYEKTVQDTEHELYRKLQDDVITRLWYNISKPYIFFITINFIKELSDVTGFSIDEKIICPFTEDYLTLAIRKKP